MALKRTPYASPTARKVKTTIKVDPVAEFRDAVQGKDKMIDVLSFSSEDIIGHVQGVISTQSLALDKVTGVGGLPRGRLVEIFGGETVGKTTVTDHVMAEIQRVTGVAAVYDSEEKKDRKYASNIGVDIDRLQGIQPKEHKTIGALIVATSRAVERWIERGLWDVPIGIIWDSVGGTATEEEIADPSNKQPGVAAREIRRAMRSLVGKIARSRALLLMVNHEYAKIGQAAFGFGPKKTTSGGGGIRYHASLRLELVRVGALKDSSGNNVGIEVLCKTAKNSMAAPREGSFAIQYGRGIVNAWSIMESLKEAKYITSAGGYSTFHPQGRAPTQWKGGWQGLNDLCVAHPQLYGELAAIYNALP